MLITPKLQTKPFESCLAGEMVYIKDGDTLLTAIVVNTDGVRNRAVVFLDDPMYEGWAVISRAPSDDYHVLSVGREYTLLVDKDGFELPPASLNNDRNAIFLRGSDWLIRVVPERGSGGYRSRLFSLRSAEIVEFPDGKGFAAFRSWSLITADPRPDTSFHEVLFRAPNPQA